MDQDEPMFHPFPRLPIELRLKIWAFVASEPYTFVPRKSFDQATCRRPVPAVLHACQESRSENLADEHGQSNGTNYPGYKLCQFENPGPRIYFSPGIDSIYVPILKNVFCPEIIGRDNVRHLVVNSCHVTLEGNNNYACLRQFSQLKTLTALFSCSDVSFDVVEEDDGEVEFSTLVGILRVFVEYTKFILENNLKDIKAKNPEWKVPTLKFAINKRLTERAGLKRP